MQYYVFVLISYRTVSPKDIFSFSGYTRSKHVYKVSVYISSIES